MSDIELPDLIGSVRVSPSGLSLAVLWPSPPHPARWMVTDQWGSTGYERDVKVASWPAVGAVPFSPAAGMALDGSANAGALDADTRLTEIRNRIPLCYEGPWTYQWNPDAESVGDAWVIGYPTDNPLAGLVASVPDYGEHLAEFIAAAREDIPFLLTAVDARDAVIQELGAQLAIRDGQVKDLDRKLAERDEQIAGLLAEEIDLSDDQPGVPA